MCAKKSWTIKEEAIGQAVEKKKGVGLKGKRRHESSTYLPILLCTIAKMLAVKKQDTGVSIKNRNTKKKSCEWYS